MSGYEIDEPEKLWNALESKQAETSLRSLPTKRPVMLWVRRSIAAAAVIAVVLTVGVFFINMRHDISHTPLLTKVADNPLTRLPNSLQSEMSHSTSDKQPANTLIAQNAPQPHNCGLSSPGSSMHAEIAEETVDNLPEENRENHSMDKENPVKIKKTPGRDACIKKERPQSLKDNGYSASVHKGAAASGKLSVSIYSSGGTGSALNYRSKGNSFVGGVIGPDNSAWSDNPALGILVFNKGREVKTDIRHRLPIRAGVTFTYNINGRIGIETGLSYANLISDVREGTESHYYTGEQKLHYVGIPVNLKYRILSWKRLDLYASAGVLAEKCVSAKLDKEYVLDDQKKGSESENLSEKPMQWSLNTSVGVQCNLVKSMSIFAEPGVSYYFDDGTDIKTIYKDKPVNLNFNLGLRFTLGR